jgi:hypothetical protein
MEEEEEYEVRKDVEGMVCARGLGRRSIFC